MTLKDIRRWQKSAMSAMRQRDLGIQTRTAIAEDIALWEIAAQLSIMNARVKSSPKRKGRK
jgi:hypothetical protein